jgi:hypothetical protein
MASNGTLGSAGDRWQLVTKVAEGSAVDAIGVRYISGLWPSEQGIAIIAAGTRNALGRFPTHERQ